MGTALTISVFSARRKPARPIDCSGSGVKNPPVADAPKSTSLSLPALIVLCATVFVSVMNASMTSVALPDLKQDFNVADDKLTWVVTAYLITFASGTVIYGRLADIVGTKRMYIFGLTLFAAASFAVGLAPSFGVVVAARALQGFGGTAVPSLSMATIARSTTPIERGRAMGATMMTVGVGFGVGPLVGGLLTDAAGWPGPFLATGVAGTLLLPLALILVPGIPGRAGQRFDVLGALLLTTAVTGSLLALNRLPREPADRLGLGGLAAAIPLSVALVLRVRLAVEPVIHPVVVRNLRFLRLSGVGMAAQGTHFAVIVMIPLLLARYHDYGVIRIGLLMLPGAIALAVAGMTGGALSNRFGVQPLIVAGMLALLAGVFMLHVAGVASGPYAIMLLYVVVGTGYGLLNAPVLTAATSELTPELAGVGIGAFNLAFFLGGAISVALVGAILRARAGADHGVNPLFSGAPVEFSDAMGVVVVLALAGFLLATTVGPAKARPPGP